MSAVRSVPLGKVATIERETVEASDIRPGSLYVGLENIESGGRFVNVRPVNAGELASNKFKFTADHLLYGKLRPYLAKIARPNFDGICSTDILPVLPSPDLDRGYLAWMLLTPALVAVASSRASGANLPRISPQALAALEIPLAPLSVQQRIAEVLDKADALRAKRRAALAQLDALTQCIFLDMFGDPFKNPKSWPRKRIGEVATVITGNTPPRNHEAYYGDDIEWIKSDNINTPHYYLTPAEERLSHLGREVARVVPGGSILVTCIAGSRECIGNAAMSDRQVAFNQQINAVVPFDGNTHFIYGHFRAGKRLIQAASTDAMKGMVSKSRFEHVPLIWPPLPLQDEFARRVLALTTIRERQRTFLAQADALFASLQHRAFRGEL